MRNVFNLISGISIAVLLLLSPIASQRLERFYIYDYKGSSVVMLTDGGGGTGFVIETNGKRYTLTNKHICRIADKKGYLYYDTQDGRRGIIKVIKKFKDHDLCVMEAVPGVRALNIASDIERHEKLWLVGHPGLRALTLENGYFVGNTTIRMWGKCPKAENRRQLIKFLDIKTPESLREIFNYEEFLIKLLRGECIVPTSAAHLNNISYGGNSGSPVLNKWGNIVGVLFAGSPSHNTNSYMVPLKHIKQFLNELGK